MECEERMKQRCWREYVQYTNSTLVYQMTHKNNSLKTQLTPIQFGFGVFDSTVQLREKMLFNLPKNGYISYMVANVEGAQLRLYQ